jgi:hypothetical protein
MTAKQKKEALKIRDVLSRQSFVDFHNGIFEDWITGAFEPDSKEAKENGKEVLEWIVDHFEVK